MDDTGRQSYGQGLGTFARGVVESLRGRLSPGVVVGEIAATLTDKLVPQGAAELAQAILGQSNAYVPYGPAQGPAPIDAEYGVHGKPLEEAGLETSPAATRPTGEVEVPPDDRRTARVEMGHASLHGTPTSDGQAMSSDARPKSPSTRNRSRGIDI